jgi:hypothetical protein
MLRQCLGRNFLSVNTSRFFSPLVHAMMEYIIQVFSFQFNHFPADVANKRHLGSAPKSHFCDLTGKTEVIGLSNLMSLFIDLGCLYCKQKQRAFNVLKT